MGSKFLPGEFVMVKGDLNSGTSDVVFQIKQVFQKFVSYKKQVQAISECARNSAILKVNSAACPCGSTKCQSSKKVWENMTWKERYEAIVKYFPNVLAAVGLTTNTATGTSKTLCQAGTTVYTLQKDVKLSSQSTNATNLPTGTKKKEDIESPKTSTSPESQKQANKKQFIQPPPAHLFSASNIKRTFWSNGRSMGPANMGPANMGPANIANGGSAFPKPTTNFANVFSSKNNEGVVDGESKTSDKPETVTPQETIVKTWQVRKSRIATEEAAARKLAYERKIETERKKKVIIRSYYCSSCEDIYDQDYCECCDIYIGDQPVRVTEQGLVVDDVSDDETTVAEEEQSDEEQSEVSNVDVDVHSTLFEESELTRVCIDEDETGEKNSTTFSHRQHVECRDSPDAAWLPGRVTSVSPLEIKLTASLRGYSWKEVRELTTSSNNSSVGTKTTAATIETAAAATLDALAFAKTGYPQQRNLDLFRSFQLLRPSTKKLGLIVNDTAVIDTSNGNNSCWKCLSCICISCGSGSHGTDSCDQHHEEALIAAAHDREIMVMCPKCRVVLERTAGCDHMTCPPPPRGCSSEFCFKCLSMNPHCGTTCKKPVLAKLLRDKWKDAKLERQRVAYEQALQIGSSNDDCETKEETRCQETKGEEKDASPVSSPPLLRFKAGDTVQVFLRGAWITGKVTKIWDQGHPYCVELEDGMKFWVPKEILNCIRDGTPLVATRFNCGDKVYVNHCEEGGWQPGKIIMVWDGDNPYRIELENGTNLCVPKDDSEHVEPWSASLPQDYYLFTAMNVISPLTKQLISAAPVQSIEKVQNVPVLWIQQRLHVAQENRVIGSLECLNTETGEVSFQGTLLDGRKNDVWVWDKVLNNPKNPSSAYGCYSGRIWPIQSSEDMANELKVWRSMSKAEKSKYENMAEKDMIRYANELMFFTAAKSEAVASFQKSRSGATLTSVLPSKKAMNESLVQSEASFQKSRSGATLTPVLTLKKAMTESLIQYQPCKWMDIESKYSTNEREGDGRLPRDAGCTFQSISYNTLNSVSKTPLSHEELRCAELGIIEFEKREENVNVLGSAFGEKTGSVFDGSRPTLRFVPGDLVQVYIKNKWINGKVVEAKTKRLIWNKNKKINASVAECVAYRIYMELDNARVAMNIPYHKMGSVRGRKKNIKKKQFTFPASGSNFLTQTDSGAFTFGSNDGNSKFVLGKKIDSNEKKQMKLEMDRISQMAQNMEQEELEKIEKQKALLLSTATSSTHALPTSSIAVPATIPTNTEVSLKTPEQLPNTTKKDTATKNTTTNDFTILYLMEADEEIKLRAKINSGSSPNSCNSAEQSALHVAAVWDAVDCGRLLIEHGANVNATNSVEVFGAQTPLMIAAMRGNIKFGKLLIECGCDVTTKSAHGSLADDFLDKTHKNYVEFHELLLPTTLLQEEAKEEERKEEGKEEQEEDLFVSDSSL